MFALARYCEHKCTQKFAMQLNLQSRTEYTYQYLMLLVNRKSDNFLFTRTHLVMRMVS